MFLHLKYEINMVLEVFQFTKKKHNSILFRNKLTKLTKQANPNHVNKIDIQKNRGVSF